MLKQHKNKKNGNLKFVFGNSPQSCAFKFHYFVFVVKTKKKVILNAKCMIVQEKNL